MDAREAEKQATAAVAIDHARDGKYSPPEPVGFDRFAHAILTGTISEHNRNQELQDIYDAAHRAASR